MFRFHTDPNGQGGQRKSLAFLWMVWTFTNKDFHTSAVYHSMTHENHLQHGLFWSNIDLSHNELQVHLFCRHFRVVSQSPHRLGRVVYISYTKPARCLARNLQPRTFGEVGARGTRCGGLMFGRNLWSANLHLTKRPTLRSGETRGNPPCTTQEKASILLGSVKKSLITDHTKLEL